MNQEKLCIDSSEELLQSLDVSKVRWIIIEPGLSSVTAHTYTEFDGKSLSVSRKLKKLFVRLEICNSECISRPNGRVFIYDGVKAVRGTCSIFPRSLKDFHVCARVRKSSRDFRTWVTSLRKRVGIGG